MTDRPIIFSAPMIRALLGGRKTQTRRVLNPQPKPFVRGTWYRPYSSEPTNWQFASSKQGLILGYATVRYVEYDRLWVREAIVHLPAPSQFDKTHGAHGTVGYLADGKGEWYDRAMAAGAKSRPSIHMPRWASRVTLSVESVRIERLRDISESDAVAEGMRCDPTTGRFNCGGRYVMPSARDAFAHLWTDLHGADAWDANPWVAAIGFGVEKRNIDGIAKVHPLEAAG